MGNEQTFEDQVEQDYLDAVRRGEDRLKNEPVAVSAKFDPQENLIVVELNRGYKLSFPPQRAQVLENATVEQLGEIEVSYPGLSIYFPKLDEDMGVDNLLKGRFGNARWEAAWAEAHPAHRAA